jgi:hypothetical protein
MKLQADGMPLQNFDGERAGDKHYIGGSGGYIFTATHNRYGENKISPDSQIRARGGFGTRAAPSGSGGVIVIAGDNTVPVENADASGGRSEFTLNAKANATDSYNGCDNGGAGTIYQTTEDRLVIDNRDELTTKLTRVNVPASKVPVPVIEP